MLCTYRAKVDKDGTICLFEKIKLSTGCEVLVTVLDKNTLLPLMGPSGEITMSEERLREELEEDKAWAYLLDEVEGEEWSPAEEESAL